MRNGKHKSKAETTNVRITDIQEIHSAEAERDVIGAMMSDPEQIIDMASERLQAEDFFNPVYQILFSSLLDMRENGILIDATTVMQYLEDRKLSNRVGGSIVVGDLAASILSILSAPTRIETVKEKSTLRQIQKACARAIYAAQEMQHDIDAVVNIAESSVLEACSRNKQTEIKQVRHAAQGVLEWVMSQPDMSGGLRGPSTGMPSLDDITLGFAPKKFWCVAAWPNVGKTLITLMWSIALCRAGHGCGIISTESSEADILERITSIVSGVPLTVIQKRACNERQKNEIAMAVEEIAGWPLHIYERPGATVAEMRSCTRNMARKKNCKVVIVDYLQNLTIPGEDEFAANTEASRTMQCLSRELSICIVAISQLTKKEKSSGPTDRPNEAHLRGTGQILQDIDFGMLLHRDRLVDGRLSLKGWCLPFKSRDTRYYNFPITISGSCLEITEDTQCEK